MPNRPSPSTASLRPDFVADLVESVDAYAAVQAPPPSEDSVRCLIQGWLRGRPEWELERRDDGHPNDL